MNPFGVPVTKDTLMQMSRYRGKPIKQEDMAREAMKLINAEGKNIKALEYVLRLKSDYGSGASTLCLVYNATGGRLDLADKKDYNGGIYKAEPPRSFENGQWLAFLHVRGGLLPTNNSVGTRVYRATHSDAGYSDVRDIMIAWNTPWDPSPTHAYTEIREQGHFPPHWNYIEGLIARARRITKDESNYFSSIVSIGGTTSPEFIAVLKHKYS